MNMSVTKHYHLTNQDKLKRKCAAFWRQAYFWAKKKEYDTIFTYFICTNTAYETAT